MRLLRGKVAVFLVFLLLLTTIHLDSSNINAESKTKKWYTIDGNVYGPYLSITNPRTYSYSPDFALDGNGNPHVTWSERITDDNAEIIYIKWDGENWTNCKGEIWDKLKNNAVISDNGDFSGQPSIALDSSDYPHIAWMDYSYKHNDESAITDVFYIKWNGDSWVNFKEESWDSESGNANVSDTNLSSYDPKIVLDQDDNPHIAWSDYSFCETNSTDGLTYETAEIIYLKLDHDDWKTIDGKIWDSETGNGIITHNIGDSFDPDFVLKSDGYPYFVWSDTSYHPSNLDNFFFNYYAEAETMFMFWNGSRWMTPFNMEWIGANGSGNLSRCDGDSDSPRIYLDKEENIFITWTQEVPHKGKDFLEYDIILAKWDGRTLTNIDDELYTFEEKNANITTSNKDSYSPSIEFDGDGNLLLSWIDENSLKLMKRESGKWVTPRGEEIKHIYELEPIYSSDGSRIFSEMKIDTHGKPHIEIITSNKRLNHFVIGDNSLRNMEDQKVDSSNNSGFIGVSGSYNKAFEMDKDGRQYIVIGSSYLNCLNWDGKKWVNPDGTDSSEKNDKLILGASHGYSRDPCLAIDSKGYPHVSWTQKKGKDSQIHYVRWDGESWALADGSKYDRDSNNSEISYTEYESVHSVLALDSNDRPHIVFQNGVYYKENRNPEIIYIKWDGRNWVTIGGNNWKPSTLNGNISKNDGDSYNPAIAIDDNNNPHIVWEDDSYSEKAPIRDSASLYNLPDIIYVKGGNQKWITNKGETWNPRTGNGNVTKNKLSSSTPAITIDSKGNPHITWEEDSYGAAIDTSMGYVTDIFYLTGRDENWFTAEEEKWNPEKGNANVSNNTDLSWFPSIGLDSNDSPYIAWEDRSYNGNSSDSDILVSKFKDGKWRAVDSEIYDPKTGNNQVSYQRNDCEKPIIRFDSNDDLHLVWSSMYYIQYR